MGTFTISTGLGMLAVGMAVITIAGMIILKVINTLEKNKKEDKENQRREKNPDIRFRPSETGYAAARELVNNGWSIGLTFGIPDEPEEEL